MQSRSPMSKVFPTDVDESEVRFSARLPESTAEKADLMAEWQSDRRKAMEPRPRKLEVSRNDILRWSVEFAWDESQGEMREWLAKRDRKGGKK